MIPALCCALCIKVALLLALWGWSPLLAMTDIEGVGLCGVILVLDPLKGLWPSLVPKVGLQSDTSKT